MVEAAYSDLFALHGQDAWNLPVDRLISYFRNADHTSALVGSRQAGTFQALAALSGHGEVPAPKAAGQRRNEKRSAPAKTPEPRKQTPDTATGPNLPSGNSAGGVGLTVRIEINLPAAGDQETYDKIFKSIRENLLNGK